MTKVLASILLFFFISGSFVAAFNSASASGLVADSWNTKTPMTQARAGLGVVAVAGKIYAIGGFAAVDDRNNYVGMNERYDPVSDTWITLVPMPTPRGYFAIVAYQDKIYCIGGAVGITIAGGYSFRAGCSVNEVYDTVTNSWSTKSSLPFDGADLQAGIVDGQIFVINGCDLYMYNTATNLWTNKTSMPTIPALNASLVSAVVDNKIIVTGKFTTFNLGREYEAQRVMIYEPKTDKWREGYVSYMQNINEKTWAAGGATGVTSGLYAPQRAYFLMFTSAAFYTMTFSNGSMGESLSLYNTTTVMSNQIYDPASDTWLSNDMPTVRTDFGVAAVDDLLYVIGGWRDDELSSLNEQYVPMGYHGPLSPDAKFSLDNATIAT